MCTVIMPFYVIIEVYQSVIVFFILWKKWASGTLDISKCIISLKFFTAPLRERVVHARSE